MLRAIGPLVRLLRAAIDVLAPLPPQTPRAGECEARITYLTTRREQDRLLVMAAADAPPPTSREDTDA